MPKSVPQSVSYLALGIEPANAASLSARETAKVRVFLGVVQIVPLPTAAYHLAEGIARKYAPHLGTRPLDVLHVVGALVLKARAFYTFDNKQAKLASTLGLRIL